MRKGFCHCGCGKPTAIAQRNNTAKGHVKGEPFAYLPLHGSRTHGGTLKRNLSPAYRSWAAMKQRCLDLDHPSSRRHGQRGIKICEQWLGKTGFANFFADMGERPKGLTLERLDTNGDYTPANCCWATMKQQSRNRINTKLTTEQVKEIREAKGTIMQKDLAARFHISSSFVSLIQSGDRWS